MLAASGLSLAAIDLRAIPKDGPVATWFDEPRATRSIGAVYTEQSEAQFFSQSRVPQLYDALLFVERTTSARPNPAGERPGVQKLAAPANLDFESGDLGMKPADWMGSSGINGLSYEVVTSEDHPHTGQRCAMIRPKPGPRYGETFGSLEQTIDAKAFQGKRIKLRAAVRTEVAGPGNQAHLWLHIRKEGFGPATLLFEDDMADRPITTREWRVFEMVGDVPKDAVRIDYGLALGRSRVARGSTRSPSRWSTSKSGTGRTAVSQWTCCTGCEPGVRRCAAAMFAHGRANTSAGRSARPSFRFHTAA